MHIIGAKYCFSNLKKSANLYSVKTVTDVLAPKNVTIVKYVSQFSPTW